MTSTADRPTAVLAMAVCFELGLGGVAALLAWWRGVPLIEQLRVTGPALLWGLLATLPLLAGFWWLIRVTWPPLAQLRRLVEQWVVPLFGRATWWQLALVSLAAGWGEELLFRGVIQWLAAAWTTPAAGMIVTSILFGAAHYLSHWYFLLATLVGLYLGALAMVSGGLVAPILAHALYDFVALLYLCRRRRPLAPGEGLA